MVWPRFKNMVRTIRTINQKYQKGHLKTTPLVRASLLFLRLYLFLLIAILVFKFVQAVRG